MGGLVHMHSAYEKPFYNLLAFLSMKTLTFFTSHGRFKHRVFDVDSDFGLFDQILGRE